MKIENIQGNLLYAKERYIAHGVNCRGVMGSGVAKALRATYKTLFEEYHKLCTRQTDEKWQPDLLGGVQFVDVVKNNKVIINCFTQIDYGTSRRQVDYDAVISCMKEINSAAKKKLDGYFRDDTRVAFPKIGAGLGGGDWKIISEIIEKESTAFQPVVYELSK